MAEAATFYFRAPEVYEPAPVAKFWTPEAPSRYALLIKRLEGHGDTDPAALEALYRGLAAELSLKLVDLAQLTRIALTGRAASPPIFEIIGILGKEETLRRLRAAQAAAERALGSRR